MAAYHESHLDLVGEEPPIRLDDPEWPILTAGGAGGPVLVEAGAELSDALLAPGSRVAGAVTRSVLSGGVVVEPGAEVVDAVLLAGVVVRAGAVVRNAVVDINAVIEADAAVGVGLGAPDAKDHIALIGAGVRVRAGRRVAPGERFAG